MANIYANLLAQKKTFAKERNSTPTGLVCDANMAAVTSCENTLLKNVAVLEEFSFLKPLIIKVGIEVESGSIA